MSSVLSAPRTLTEMLNDEHRQIEVLSPKIKWQINADKNEAHAELRFPCGLHKSDDIKIELDEAKRTITMNVQRVSGPDNCRMSSWEYKQTLDDSLDLSKLQASVDFKKGLLLLHSPLQLADSTVEASQLIEKKSSNEDKGYNSEEEQPPGSEVSDEDTEVEVDLKTSKDTSQPGGTSGNAIEIEDVGPDEDSDRISISSSESRDSVSWICESSSIIYGIDVQNIFIMCIHSYFVSIGYINCYV